MRVHPAPLLVVAGLLCACADEEPREALSLSQGCVETLAPEEGRLVVLEELGPPVVRETDLSTGASTPLFEVPSSGFAFEFDLLDEDLVIAYTPPPTKDGPAYDRSGLARVVGGAPELLAAPAKDTWSFYPAWEPSGDGIWFVRDGEDVDSTSALARHDLADGSVTTVVGDATEPAVSPDGEHVAWVSVDPRSGARQLVLGDGDAQAPQVLVGSELGDLGQPFFSRDGEWLYFVVLVTADTNPLLDLLVPSAMAHASHDTPGDWWRVPVTGGEPEQVTRLGTILYDGAASPTSDRFVTATREGVALIDPATGDPTMLRCMRTARAVGLR